MNQFEKIMSNKSTDKLIQIITAGLVIIFLLYIYNTLDLTIMILQEPSEWDISVLEYLAPIILFPIGIFGFWNLKKYGWTIIAIILVYMFLGTLLSTGMKINGIESFFFIIRLLITGILLYFINKTIIINKFHIKKKWQFLTLALASIPLLIFWLILFY